jgi:hypothetical protein
VSKGADGNDVRTGFSAEDTQIWSKASKSDKEKLNKIMGSEMFEFGLKRSKVEALGIE